MNKKIYIKDVPVFMHFIGTRSDFQIFLKDMKNYIRNVSNNRIQDYKKN
ncbi:hypothetical protein [Tepidibacter formicigenes]|jgi:hypothetical protein|uniref:Uncharacterized protein n=1 Tax=Tepidibacter formicigenes DSM 15518 TaxID=1123349 RepID=A0A1M6SMP6_9FIRM|nr:hypothetical protein [Tepidibacter formicigenes]SHK45907.1 hypothetical protein SAMN02744037_02379 [Tepidibacter formicigenes DSM 15518]